MSEPTASIGGARDGGAGQGPSAASFPGGVGEHAGESIGPYRLLQVIGEGGFGVVWQAERREPFVQRVAMKIIKPGMDSKAVIARFEQERQALAVMDHPNIARVLDGGITPPEMGARPYFVMELVKGEPITEFCDRARLTILQRVELFIPVCEAVQHAHSKGVIHRDIKPSNILVATPDAPTTVPPPKVIDFGVAKAISRTLTDKTIFTETGVLIGTPEYMSPEQAEMGALDVDTRSDVYSLGVVLYELLTGALPFDSHELRAKGYDEIRRIIRETEPPSPSRRLTILAGGPGGEAAEIVRRRSARFDDMRRQLKRELEWIPLKAMRKDRETRYRTAMEMADDLRNYLAGRPLAAGPESAVYRARKFLRKHRLGAVVALLLASTLVAATAVSLVFYRQAVIRGATALEVERFLADDLLSMGGTDTAPPGLLARTLVDRAAATLDTRFPGRPEVEGRVRAAVGGAYLAVGEPVSAAAQLERSIAALDSAGLASDDLRFRAAMRLTEALYRQGKTADSEALLLPAIEARRSRMGDDDPLVLEARHQLAGAFKHAGRLDEAQAIYTDVLAHQRRSIGGSSAKALITQYNLALVTLARGQQARASDPEKSKELFEKALDELRPVRAAMGVTLGPEADQTLWAGAEYAALLSRLGRYDEAVAAFEPILTGMKKRFGERHWRTLEAQANYAIACARAGAWTKAVAAFTDSAAGYREVRGATYPDTIVVLRWLARAQEETGDLTGAEQTLTSTYDTLAAAGTEPARLREQAGLLAAFFERRTDKAKSDEWGRRAATPDPGR